jgi:hypothetical protein
MSHHRQLKKQTSALLAGLGSSPAGRLQVQLPKPVRRFVTEFDAGHHPMITREQSVSAQASVTAIR